MRHVRYKYLWIPPIIGFIFGYFFIEDEFESRFLGGVVIGVVALFIHLLAQYIYASITGFFYDGRTFIEQEEKYIDYILALSAEMARIDGKITETEKNHIKNRLELDLSVEKAEKYYNQFIALIEQEINFKKVCKKIDREFDDASKYQLMFILVGLATADGVLSKKEVNLLKDIGKNCDISAGKISQILSLFQFKVEGQKRKKTQERQKTSREHSTNSNGSRQYKRAFEILGIPENADINTIKSTYRKLAMEHHPDKVAHLGPSFQKQAKEIFQTIGDAYNLIKSKKGF